MESFGRLTPVGCTGTLFLFLRFSNISAFMQDAKYSCGFLFWSRCIPSRIRSFAVKRTPVEWKYLRLRWALDFLTTHLAVISSIVIPFPLALYFSIAQDFTIFFVISFPQHPTCTGSATGTLSPLWGSTFLMFPGSILLVGNDVFFQIHFSTYKYSVYTINNNIDVVTIFLHHRLYFLIFILENCYFNFALSQLFCSRYLGGFTKRFFQFRTPWASPFFFIFWVL
jgi:hypothetical protein